MKILPHIAAALLASLAMLSIGCGSSSATGTPTPSPTPTPTPTSNAAGVAVVSGQLVIAGTSTPFIPRGFNTNGALYPTQYAATLCPLATPLGTGVIQYLEDTQAALTAPPLPGLAYNASFQAMVQDWHANTVRIHVSQGALQYEYAHGLSAYTDMARGVIAQARAAGLVVIIDMQQESYGCTPDENGTTQRLPDINTEQAWKQILNPTLTSDKGIILEIFNEPDAETACNVGTFTQPDWTAWETGCGSEPDQGMLTVGQYVRSLAPNNVLFFNGQGVDFGFSGFTVPAGMPSNSAYTFHPFGYVVQNSESASVSSWDTWFGNLEKSGHAVVATAWDEDFECPSDPNQTITDEFLLTYLPQHSIGIIGYAWDGPYWGSGYLVNSYDYTGNTANYQLVDPDSSGCPQNGGRELQQLFQTQAAAN
ncbi:MAG: cellulase family glycosylhydrolase [Acidobacteriaceae bacterium]